MRVLLTILSVLISFWVSAQSSTTVFEKKKDGYRNYRIPAITKTTQGTILAFAEGRSNLSDHSENDIVLKRSSDNGNTWGELILVAEDSTNALNNPEVLALENGKILLMFQRYARGYGERDAMPGMDGNRICKTFITWSEDDGLSWSEPKDITNEVKRPEATSVASGPGIGIELKKGQHRGRLVMPFNQGPWKNWYVYMAYSDNGGNTWKKGELAPYKKKQRGWANEVQVLELSDGTLMLNARSETGNRKRKIAFSDDGGQTWAPVEDDKQLLEPECQASLIRYNEETILFCNPRHRTRRLRGTVYASQDDGKTWPHRRTIYKGGFAYSGLVALPNNEIGILFEKDGYESIDFLKVKLEDILNPKLK